MVAEVIVMRKKEIYIADDGTEFDSFKECQYYELGIEEEVKCLDGFIFVDDDGDTIDNEDIKYYESFSYALDKFNIKYIYIPVEINTTELEKKYGWICDDFFWQNKSAGWYKFEDNYLMSKSRYIEEMNFRIEEAQDGINLFNKVEEENKGLTNE